MARIVVIDDARDFTDMVADILHEGGHDVEACNVSDEALSCVVRAHPDLVLLDIRFGDNQETGWDVLDELRAHPLTAGIPVIVSSAAQDSLRSRETWLRTRDIPVLPKPFDLDELLDLVTATLDWSSRAASSGDL